MNCILMSFRLIFTWINLQFFINLSDGFKWISRPSNKTLAHIGSTAHITWHYECNHRFGISNIYYNSAQMFYRYTNEQNYSQLKSVDAHFSVIGESNVTIIILDVDKDKHGSYCCEVNCDGLLYKKCTTLVIYALPRINYLTSNLYGKQGDSITLKCNASGYPAPRVRWIHKDTNTTIAHSSVTSFNITSKASGGKYCCHVSNGFGNGTNCTSLGVIVLPRIYNLTSNRYGKQGDSITLRCNVFGHPAPRVRWTHKDTSTTIAHSSVTSYNITGKASGGKYCCHVSNDYGNGTNCTSLEVTEYQPTNTGLTSKVKSVGRNMTFQVSCKADAFPPATYFIQQGDKTVGNSSDGNVTITTPVNGTSITIKCIAKNKYGEGVLVYHHIPIFQPPTIVTHPNTSITLKTNNITLKCKAKGTPTPVTTWYDATSNEVVANGTFQVKNDDCKDKTLLYYCNASNVAGYHNSPNITVKVVSFCEKEETKRNGDNRLQIIIVVIVCTLVIFALSMTLVFILLIRRRTHSKREIRGKQEIYLRENQLVEESPYGEPVDAIKVRTYASASNADYATVEETGYKRVITNHLPEPQHDEASSSEKGKPYVDPVYAKVKKKHKKKDKSADVPMRPLYDEIPGNMPNSKHPPTPLVTQPSPKTSANNKISNEEEDEVDSGQGSWFSWAY